MSDYTIVPALQRARIDDYSGLFLHAFGADGKLSTAYLDWQYLRNPHGQVIGFDAYHGDELAAHYAIIPRRYRCGDRVYSAALSVNTATHPKHQGQGLFTRLAELTYAAAVMNKVAFVVGAANANSVHGFVRKLGFKAIGHIRLYAGFKAPANADDWLRLQVDADWLAWRLANPSRKYLAVAHNDGTATLRTCIKGIPFNIGRVDGRALHARDGGGRLATGSPFMPGLAPLFAPAAPFGPKLPLKLQPSPWHMIWRTLDPAIDPSLPERLHFDGLSMDTF